MLVINGNRKIRKGTMMPASAAIHAVRNERGIALVVALVMLVLLSILGSFALSTSSSELFIAGNYRNAQDAFYSAEAALEYAEMDPNVYSAIIPNTTNNWPSNGDYNPVPVGSMQAQARVEWLTYGPLPVGMATDQDVGSGLNFQGAYYVVQVIGAGRTNTNAAIALEAEIVKVVPK
jgi:hypothetical protein